MEAEEIQQSYLRNLIGGISGWSDPQDKLNRAFAQHDFVLYSQTILRLAPGGDERSHSEIFVRLRAEEQNLVAPGSFMPILEHYNFGPKLDRYVVRNVLVWSRTHARTADAVWHINLCGKTLADTEFPRFVGNELKATGLAGDCICFELPDVDALNEQETLDVVQRLKALECRVAVGSLERQDVLFHTIRHLVPDFVKIGGRLVREMQSDEIAAAKITAAIRAFREFGIQTIVQHIEDTPTLEMLKRLGADYGQGYGILKPGPLNSAA